MIERRDYQKRGTELAVALIDANVRGSALLEQSPTGSGKSYIELDVLAERPGGFLITPSLDIVADLLRKLGHEPPEGEEARAALAQSLGIWTPMRLRNKLIEGLVKIPPYLIIDEAHHAQADSYQEIEALCGDVPKVGLTATGFRGSPKSTAKFLARWGEPTVLLTIREAKERGIISMPVCRVVPLLDDDIIKVENGEFSVKSANEEIGSRVEDAVRLIRGYYDGTKFDKPTMLAVPSTECVGMFDAALRGAGVPCHCVTADTGPLARRAAFESAVACESILVQIKVVGEGVDLPLRRLIDLRPTLSPVAFLQILGRIMRPGGESEYVCCNRNLLRHAYLLEGLIPPAIIAEGTDLFQGPGKNNGMRAIGLEGVGRFKPCDIKFLDGTTGQLFSVSTVSDGRVEQYTVLLHPCLPDPLVARREYVQGGDPRSRPKWVKIERLPDLTGYASVKPSEPTPKMRAWWLGEGNMQGAEYYGLEPNVKVTWKNFQALPVLSNLRVRFSQ